MLEEILRNSFKIFIILDPIGMFPIIMSYLEKMSFKMRSSIINSSILTAFIISCIVLLFGNMSLKLLLLKVHDIKISGGILLLVIGYSMLKTGRKIQSKNLGKSNINPIFPIAIPLLCGPGTITTIMIIKNSSSSVIAAYLSVFAGMSLSLLVIYLLNRFSKFINHTILIIVKPIASLITIFFGISIMFDGISSAISVLRSHC